MPRARLSAGRYTGVQRGREVSEIEKNGFKDINIKKRSLDDILKNYLRDEEINGIHLAEFFKKIFLFSKKNKILFVYTKYC